MNELIKYFESLEARISADETRLAEYETRIAALEAEVKELQNRPLPEPQVVEKIVEKIVEVEKPIVIAAPIVEQEVPVAEPEPIAESEPEMPEAPEVPEVQEPIAKPEPMQEPAQESVQEKTEPEPMPVVEESVGSKAVLYGTPVTDIRQAISLGDRFLYQRELFGQNAELMQKTLTDLNALHSFDEAISYVMTHFQWDAESSTYQQFLVTLHRRFG